MCLIAHLLRCLLLIGGGILCLPLLLPAADYDQIGSEDIPVQLEADQLSYDRDKQVYRASGDVRLIQGDMEVRGQQLEWWRARDELKASGNVRLLSPDQELSGSTLRYSLLQGTGTVEQGHFFLYQENLHVRGRTIERRGESEYRIEHGTFTTCDGEVPPWKFGARRVDVTLGGYARARNAVFYLKNIPCFYLPYLVYPAKTERESGLLIPRVGYSQKRGFQYSGAYYQVLGINQDATFFLDYLTEMGLGKGLEYRYIFGRDNAGEARVYHIDVDQVDGVEIDEERYALEWQHDGSLPGGVKMVADVEYVNDDQYFEDFGDQAEEYNKDKVESVFSLSKNWGKYNLVGQVKYTKDLEVSDQTTLQLLPRISFDRVRQRIGESFFYTALESEYTHFWRREGLRGQRLMLRPVLSASYSLAEVIDITPEIGYRERVYWGLSNDADSDHQGIPEFSISLNTRLQKVYQQGVGAISKLRHVLEPELVYKFTPEEEQEQLPNFDRYDRIAEVNRLEYALVQRLTARFERTGQEPMYRDIFYLRLSQPYDLRDAAAEERFGAIRAELDLRPLSWLSLSSDTSYEVDTGDWNKLALELKLHEQQGNSMRIEYRYDRDREVDYGAVDLSLAYLKPLYVNYQQRYDFSEQERLEQVVALEYRQQCWSTQLSYREREDEQSLMLSFTMRGIGEVGGVSGSFGGM